MSDKEDDVGYLKGKRKVIKSALTRFETFLNKFISVESSDYNEVEMRLNNVQTILEEFNTIQYSIEVASTNGGEILTDDSEREQFENNFYRLTAVAKRLIDNNDKFSQKSNVSVNTLYVAKNDKNPTSQPIDNNIQPSVSNIPNQNPTSQPIANNIQPFVSNIHNQYDNFNFNANAGVSNMYTYSPYSE